MTKLKQIKNLIFILFLAWNSHSQVQTYDPANVDLTLGPEFEFAPKHAVAKRVLGMNLSEIISVIKNGDIDPSQIEYKQLKKFAQKISEKCQECKLEMVEGKFSHLGLHTFRFIFPDGWFFSLEPDVLVVEVTSSPMLLSKENLYKERLQKYVFDSAKEVGLTINGHSNFMNRPAGHFNFGMWSAFGDSGKNFLRYFVDRANYPELSMGGFYKDYFNAPPLSVLKVEQRNKLKEIVSQLENSSGVSPSAVAKLIFDQVYTNTYFFDSKPYHFQSTGLKSAIKASGFDENDRPMEHRDHKMQESAEEFFQIGKLLKKRIEFLNTSKSPISYLALDKKSFSAKEVISAYYIFISEMNEDPESFKNLLLPKLRNVEPFAISVAGKTVDWNNAKEVAYIKENFNRLLVSNYFRERLVQAVVYAAPGESHIVANVMKDLNSFAVKKGLAGKDQKTLMALLTKIDSNQHPFKPKLPIIDSKVFRVLSCSQYY